MRGKYWTLDDNRRPIEVGTLDEWLKFFVAVDRTVAQSKIGDVLVSTVFLGIDHNYGDGPPLLFETMIFGGDHDERMERCSTWKQAEHMHERACSLVRKDMNS